MITSSFKKVSAALALGVGLGMSWSAAAVPTNFSFAGSFSADDNVQLFNFTANGASNVRLISFSYGGGTQSNGNVVARGGFDPILALFDSAGVLVGQNDDAVSGTSGACGSGVVTPDAVTNREWDTCLDLVLAAGAYQVAVMQFSNFALGPNLANGFTYTGAPNFTASLTGGGCTNGQFCDVSTNAAGNNRTNLWAFDILNVEQANQTPEPTTLVLAALGLAGLGFGRRRRPD